MIIKSFRILILIGCVCVSSSASATTFTPKDDIIGVIKHYRVSKKDTLYDIARRYDIGIVELLAANPGVDPWEPKEGTPLTLTTMHLLPPVRDGIVLNLSELRLFYFLDGKVMTFPIGIGREGWETPLGETIITNKRKDPTWTPPPSIRAENPNLPEVIPAGPDNPLGAFAMNLGMPGYLIHGTNRPYGVGKRSSHGCIRLYPEDIKKLFSVVPIGTSVTIMDTPYKLGWQEDTLYLEITPTQEQADIIAEYKRPKPREISEIYEAVKDIAGDDTEIDWYAVDQAVQAQNGIPVAIGKK